MTQQHDSMSADTIPGQLDAIRERLDSGEARMTQIEDRIAENTDITRDIRELMEAGRAGFRVLGWIGHVAKWVGAIAAASASIYALIHHKPPH